MSTPSTNRKYGAQKIRLTSKANSVYQPFTLQLICHKVLN